MLSAWNSLEALLLLLWAEGRWKHHYSLKSNIRTKFCVIIIKSWWCSNLFNFNQNILQACLQLHPFAPYCSVNSSRLLFAFFEVFLKCERGFDFNFKENFSLESLPWGWMQMFRHEISLNIQRFSIMLIIDNLRSTTVSMWQITKSSGL